jgi:hypothetical protein
MDQRKLLSFQYEVCAIAPRERATAFHDSLPNCSGNISIKTQQGKSKLGPNKDMIDFTLSVVNRHFAIPSLLSFTRPVLE